jgi:ribosomal-protein-alanine N-acetyltransferase
MTTTAPFDPKYVSLLWAGPEQAEEIARLHGQLFSPVWSVESIRTLLDHPGSTAFLAAYGPPPKVSVGFVMAQLAADEAEILTLGVMADFQRKGVGRRLLDGVARAVTRAEAKKLFLEVAADNDAALALYYRAGFLGTGLRRGYYARPAGPAVDALTLALKL